MSGAALEALIATERALIAALDADDVAGIAQHSATMEQAIVRIRVTPRGPADPALAEEAMRLADAARVRINVLADTTARRITRLAEATGIGTVAPTYGRDARLRR
jgi:hypothetical protein